MVINQWNITLFIQQKNWMQRARQDFISGKPDVSDSEGGREVLWLSTVKCIVLLTLWFIILSCFLMLKQTALSLCIGLTDLLFTQSGCTYQKFRAPARLVLTQHVCRPSPTEPSLAHLLQPSQGLLNKPRPSASRSDHFTQTNRALGLRRGSGMVQNTQCE